MKNVFLVVIAIFVTQGASVAQARPFSTTEELAYLKGTLSQLAQQEGASLVESSVTLEASALNAINPVYNITPFRLITGPTDDRAYTVYFSVQSKDGFFKKSAHFRAQDGSCTGNATTKVFTSSLNGKLGCMTVYLGATTWSLQKPVSISAMDSE